MIETKAKTVKKQLAKEVKVAKVATAVSHNKYIETIGKRKTAAARIRMFANGKGDIKVNGAPLVEYFKTPLMQMIIAEALKGTALENKFDITIKVNGGGKQAQAEAVRHGMARALLVFDKDLRPVLRAQRWLTRDAREKERKKPGLKKARKAPQWSKR
jgi:small subunit ribosomal protein S9